MKKFKVTVNGKPYEVEVETLANTKSQTIPPFSAGASISAAEVAAAPKKPVAKAAGAGEVLSPLAGKVVSIDTKVGQTVAEGEKIMTLEAMKMNTFVISPAAGTLKEILVAPGQAVEEGMVLARLE